MLTLLPIPANLPKWQVTEIEKYRKNLENPTEMYFVDGVRYWKSNNAVIPPFVYKDAYVVCPEQQQTAYTKRNEKFIADYKRKEKEADEKFASIKQKIQLYGFESLSNHEIGFYEMKMEDEMENQAEMRAEFGEGSTVVNILTGKKTKL